MLVLQNIVFDSISAVQSFLATTERDYHAPIEKATLGNGKPGFINTATGEIFSLGESRAYYVVR